jgi:hypothetical protein
VIDVELREVSGARGIVLIAYADARGSGQPAEVPPLLLATLLPGEEVHQGVVHGSPRIEVLAPPRTFGEPEWGILINHLRDAGHRVTVRAG